jgi:hypothetical protein
MSHLLEHAEREFAALNWDKTGNELNGWMKESVLSLLRVFSEQGHSGFSAPHCIELFSKLASFQPLGPLTGNDSEWNEVASELFQNNRCSHVFKDQDGTYDINGIVFREPNGCCYTSSKSATPVTFPYTPTTKYVDVEVEQ